MIKNVLEFLKNSNKFYKLSWPIFFVAWLLWIPMMVFNQWPKFYLITDILGIGVILLSIIAAFFLWLSIII